MNIKSIIIEGLDGSGKGTYTDLLSKLLIKCNFNVIVVDYPQYSTKIGRRIRELLHVSDSEKELNIEERMAIYALNRIESIDSINEKVKEFSKESDNDIYIIYDRSHFSNAITCAYYFHKRGITDIQEVFHKYYKFMFKIDYYFIKELNLSNTPVYIPIIDPEVSIKSLRKDATREKIDHYEDIDIQRLANENYLYIASKTKNVFLIDQLDNDGVRLSPKEIAKVIFEKELGDNFISNVLSENSNTGMLFTLKLGDNIKNSFYKEMQELVEKYKLYNLRVLVNKEE